MESLLKILEVLPRAALATLVYGSLAVVVTSLVASYWTGPIEIVGLPIGFKEWRAAKELPTITRDPPKDLLEWSQRQYVSDLGRNAARDTSEFTDVILKCYQTFKDSPELVRQNVVAKNEASQIIRLDKFSALRKAVGGFLNFLDGVAAAYEYGVADKTMFKDLFQTTIGTWYGRLEGYMEVYKADCRCEFPAFERLGKIWKDQRVVPISDNRDIKSCVNSP